jgi:hypothetical protein
MVNNIFSAANGVMVRPGVACVCMMLY